MTDRYQKIRDALAMEPTPGPWTVRYDYVVQAPAYDDGRLVPVAQPYGVNCDGTDLFANAHLIAACDPDTIRALLAERDALAAALEAARVDAWQPIETCPSDDRVVMFCDERSNIWTDVAENKSADCTGFPPTHWRELPAPPALAKFGGGL